jgi:uncharacterized protein with ParB-like and HNH nuclease domain
MAAINLFELFNGKIFRIPDYQRGYAWEEKQLQELWDDVEEIPEEIGELKKHYTGTIYLEEITPQENEKWLTAVKFYDVVDGQQRLTTISIFIFELLKLATNGYNGESKDDLEKVYLSKTNSSGNSTVYKFSYAYTDNNYNFLLRNIFENKSFILKDKNLNLYTKNLDFAKKYFASKLNNINHQQRETIFKKLTSALQFDIRTIEKDLDVQAVFETMNNRGKPLSTLEKLKNRLIYLTEKLKSEKEDKKNLRDKINDAWGKIYSCLAQNPEFILDEDIFLSAHLSLYRKPKEAVFSENVAEEKVFQMFCNKSEKFDKDESGEKEQTISYSKIEDYILKLSEAAPIWYKIHNSQSLFLKKILLLNSGKELKVFLLALLLKSDEECLKQIFLNLEKILFRNKTLWLFDERTTATWGRDIYNAEDSVEGINQKIEELIKSPIVAQSVIQGMNNLFTYERGPKGFHRWVPLKYFLFSYEEKLKDQFRETNDKVTIDDYDLTTIEHIIPQQFLDNWSTVVNDFTTGLDEDEIPMAQKVLVNTLGNLTILKNGKNSSLGNLGWADKRNRFSTGSYNEIDISKNTEWTKNEVMKRGIEMLLFLENKIDGLKFTDEEKTKILFYDEYVINKFKA